MTTKFHLMAPSPAFVNVGFVANYASERGGAFANDAFTYSSCSRCKFLGNACGGKGGAVYLDFTSSPAFEGSVFEHNFALDAGGAIAADGSSTFLLSRSVVTRNTARFAEGMTAAGFSVGGDPAHPISPVHLGDARLASEFADEMLEKGIYVIGFSFPVVPKGKARIRTQLSAVHSDEDIDRCVEAFTEIGKAKGVI